MNCVICKQEQTQADLVTVTLEPLTNASGAEVEIRRYAA